ADGPEDDSIAKIVERETGDDDEHQSALEQRRQRVQPMPLPVGEGIAVEGRRRLSLARRFRRLRRAHRPVRRVSATSMSVSRSASAAAWVSPGICTPVVAAAVTIFSWETPNARSN